MTNEFTYYCTRYYKLRQQLNNRDAHFQNLLTKALPYTGQTTLNDLDAIIDCNRKVQKARDAVQETITKLHETGRTVLQIMDYFEMPRNTKLMGEIPGELEFEIWADEENFIYCTKTRDLAPLEDDPNIITIKMWSPYDEQDED